MCIKLNEIMFSKIFIYVLSFPAMTRILKKEIHKELNYKHNTPCMCSYKLHRKCSHYLNNQ